MGYVEPLDDCQVKEGGDCHGKPKILSSGFHIDPDVLIGCYFLLSFLLNPASPSNPEPNKNMVAGSGTGATVVLKKSFPQ